MTTRLRELLKKGYPVVHEDARYMFDTLPALLDALDEARGALRECRGELWDEWHSGMSEGDFENHWLVMQITNVLATIEKLNPTKGN